MFTNYHRHLYLLTIIVIFLVLLPIVNCTSHHMKETSIGYRMRPTTIIKDHLNNILEQENLNNNSEEELKNLLANMLKVYPQRRAALFYAMRGKRSTNIT
ncbi:unnamed protein product [Rotaria sp. Silwood1]|nr:unnamed protein product [Rotaria sp. Silwood1]CAF1347634.1 unnamed protein product [Rotaria sp. Silwood1]CAF1349225.1 unnamed protein product [Rotaria sp. Silwood1]CAF3511399.1 unnamed protein product [Rotaria sp. Silwood1]CAF3623831.1 unnamed protein product [Rotaria sp. Silwood1]